MLNPANQADPFHRVKNDTLKSAAFLGTIKKFLNMFGPTVYYSLKQ
jgi:hypothetical protein